MNCANRLGLRWLVGSVCLAIVFSTATSAWAVLLAYEGFDYPANTNIVGLNGGTGWAGAWDAGDGTNGLTVTQANSLTYTDSLGNVLQTKGGKLLNSAIVSPASQEGRTLNFRRGADGATGSTWFSFVGQRLGTAPFPGGSNVTLFDSTANPAPFTTDQKINMGKNSSQSVNGVEYWQMNHPGIPNAVTDPTLPPSSPNNGRAGLYFTSTPISEKVFFVARIDHNAGVMNAATVGNDTGNDDFRFWINPNLNATPSDASTTGQYLTSHIVTLANAAAAGAGVAPYNSTVATGGGVGGELSFQRIRMFARANDTEWVFDEFRVGETFQDIAPIVGPAGLQGDFNNDQKVDAADYTVWRDNLGAATDAPLNGNGDATVGVGPGDYDLWKSKFGTPGAGSLGGAIPEPSTLLLVGLALVGLPALRRRHG
jgi:hypothetical protein